MTAEPILHPVFLPYTEDQLCEHFVLSGPKRVAKWRERIARAERSAIDDPSFLDRDETLWTAGALLAVHRAGDRQARWRGVLTKAFGERPPLDDAATWDEFLDGELKLYFEVAMPSPPEYRRWLAEHLAERHPLLPQVELGAGRGVLEGRTTLDALLLNQTRGYAALFEAKVLSDIDPKTSFDALRNQLARNLDAMNASPKDGPISKRRPERSLFALLTPRLFKENLVSRLYGWLYTEYRRDPASLNQVLQHLDGATCASLSRRLGWLTFEDIAAEEPSACGWLAPSP